MNFKPELAEQVMRGEKTVTRRLTSENPRSPWWRKRCGLKVNHTYAVCPGRGKNAIGRVRVVSTRRQPLHLALLSGEAEREGFQDAEAFIRAWKTINGGWDDMALVWRVEFAVVPAEDLALWEHAG